MTSDALRSALEARLGTQYQIESLLGQGGMGSVFRAMDRTLHRPVAIKVISGDVALNPQLKERFLLEARTVAKLRHPNIVAVYSAGEADGLLYFVMELVPGESLRDLLTREGTVAPERGERILHELAMALDYAHANGIVHRDVKPENILLDRDTGRAMLTDFGVARALENSGNMTGTCMILGSPRYMSPEQATGESTIDGRSDLYALALVGYEMFTGKPVVDSGNVAGMLVKHLTETPKPLGEAVPKVPEGTAVAIDRALAKDRDQRWATGREMAEVIAASWTPTPGSGATRAIGAMKAKKATRAFVTEMLPGADIAITIRPSIQAAAQQALAPYAQAATAVVDPNTGDVWALASQPGFNPNAMTLGTTLAGEPLTHAGPAQIVNKAVLAAYPAGSSFKPFTLAAALKTGVVTPSSTRPCPSTWQYGNFTFRNYRDQTLPGSVGLAESMAFSCNTTYMPLSMEVYEADETALTDLVFEFGFGAATGIGYLSEETGIVPDDAWLAANGRGGYSGFEQIQLSIGQGAFLGTPLQLANAYAAIGNGGTLWRPRILTAATLANGTVVEQVDPTVVRQIGVSTSDLAFVTDTLQAVTTLSYGTATAAFAGFGIPVAGKSGTAETGTPDPHAWFPAFAPADAPTISVATVLPFIPLGTGGSDAAPLVRGVMAAHFAD